MLYAGVPKGKRNARAKELLEMVGMQDRMQHKSDELSGGQKQRAAAARAFITKPHLILADEPTGALDTKSARDLLDALEFLHGLGATILMVTHDSSVASHSDRIVFIRDGRLWGQMSRGGNDRKTFLARIIAATSQLEEGEEDAC